MVDHTNVTFIHFTQMLPAGLAHHAQWTAVGGSTPHCRVINRYPVFMGPEVENRHGCEM